MLGICLWEDGVVIALYLKVFSCTRSIPGTSHVVGWLADSRDGRWVGLAPGNACMFVDPRKDEVFSLPVIVVRETKLFVFVSWSCWREFFYTVPSGAVEELCLVSVGSHGDLLHPGFINRHTILKHCVQKCMRHWRFSVIIQSNRRSWVVTLDLATRVLGVQTLNTD